jgi:lipoyl(octanoyl) transferase
MNSCEWKIQHELVGYAEAQYWMEKRVVSLQKGEEPECVWLLEHPPLYTLGTSAKEKDVLPSATFPTFRTGRGGQVTYHGPGQRVVYLMLDLKTRKQDLHWYVHTLEEWLIQTLKHFGVEGERRSGRIGIWVNKEGQDYKIAALGVRVQRWVTSHGVALNVTPDLSAYKNIVPCGLSQYGVTSMAALGLSVTLPEVDEVLKSTFPFASCVS